VASSLPVSWYQNLSTVTSASEVAEGGAKEQKPHLWETEEAGRRFRGTRHRETHARTAILPTPRTPGMARGACSAMPSLAPPLTLAPRKTVQKGATFGV
jgi:hypothetical protein